MIGQDNLAVATDIMEMQPMNTSSPAMLQINQPSTSHAHGTVPSYDPIWSSVFGRQETIKKEELLKFFNEAEPASLEDKYQLPARMLKAMVNTANVRGWVNIQCWKKYYKEHIFLL